MNTEIFTWKPSDWGENHGSFTIFKNLLYQQLLEGATTPYNNFTSLLLEWATTLLYNHFPGCNWKGLQPLHAYNVGPSTTLPPYDDQKRKDKEKTQANAMDCLISLI